MIGSTHICPAQPSLMKAAGRRTHTPPIPRGRSTAPEWIICAQPSCLEVPAARRTESALGVLARAETHLQDSRHVVGSLTFRFSGAYAASLHVAGCGLMGDLAAQTMAGCRLMWPGVCGRWLPVWLPTIVGAAS